MHIFIAINAKQATARAQRVCINSIENILRMHWMRNALEALNGAAYLLNIFYIAYNNFYS
jgi:hypothetical protein